MLKEIKTKDKGERDQGSSVNCQGSGLARLCIVAGSGLRIKVKGARCRDKGIRKEEIGKRE
jgi:hypothetical protein